MILLSTLAWCCAKSPLSQLQVMIGGEEAQQKDMDMESSKPGVLLFPYPRQGHVNPMLQFSKLLSLQGLHTTLVLTTSIADPAPIRVGPVSVEIVSDGYTNLRARENDGIQTYLSRLRAVGSESLARLIERINGSSSGSVSCLVYDSLVPWALDVAKRLGLRGAAFFTQPCHVNAVYYCVFCGWLTVPLAEDSFAWESLPILKTADMPSFVSAPDYSPAHLGFFLDQFTNIHGADWIFCNTIYELEEEVIDWLFNLVPIKSVGPLIPSKYLGDARYEIKEDKAYGADLSEEDTKACHLNWLDQMQPRSVVYVSSGSITKLAPRQAQELAWGLVNSKHPYIWVIRKEETGKFEENLMQEISKWGLVVNWCNQMEVLAHKSIGCFVTHCGWNSILEAMSLGVPMVALPQWTDQPTNAMCLEDLWGVGVRGRVDGEGVVRREEVERCLREVMDGGENEVRRNARKWREVAVMALSSDGQSTRNIQEFLGGLT